MHLCLLQKNPPMKRECSCQLLLVLSVQNFHLFCFPADTEGRKVSIKATPANPACFYNPGRATETTGCV